MGDSVTLRLGGFVTMANFARATSDFSKALAELTKERSADARVEWVISGLEYGSAILTASPLPFSAEDEDLVPALVGAFIEVARQVQEHPAVLDRPVLRLIHSISQVAVDEEHEVVFETAESEVLFFRGSPSAPRGRQPQAVLGTVRGRVQTLQQRKGLRFVLYDLIHDKAVTCYLSETQEDLMRNAWGRLVEVSGTVTRDLVTDRPRAVRRVTDVKVLADDGGVFDFRRARGVVRPAPDAPPSEVSIRRVRDAV